MTNDLRVVAVCRCCVAVMQAGIISRRSRRPGSHRYRASCLIATCTAFSKTWRPRRRSAAAMGTAVELDHHQQQARGASASAACGSCGGGGRRKGATVRGADCACMWGRTREAGRAVLGDLAIVVLVEVVCEHDLHTARVASACRYDWNRRRGMCAARWLDKN